MTLSELQTEVINITKRPDLLSGVITSAIKSATLKLHQLDFYPKDVFETVVTFPTADYLQVLDYLTVVPLYRALKYIRKIDSTSNLVIDPPLTILTPEDLLDNYRIEKTNVAYEAGQVINIKMNTQTKKIQLGCYINPNIVDATYSSWIARLYPYAIIWDASATVFKATGFFEQEASMRLLVQEQKDIIMRNNVQSVGY
jgi:hypothetical protein